MEVVEWAHQGRSAGLVERGSFHKAVVWLVVHRSHAALLVLHHMPEEVPETHHMVDGGERWRRAGMPVQEGEVKYTVGNPDAEEQEELQEARNLLEEEQEVLVETHTLQVEEMHIRHHKEGNPVLEPEDIRRIHPEMGADPTVALVELPDNHHIDPVVGTDLGMTFCYL